jgi:hypothetical protein
MAVGVVAGRHGEMMAVDWDDFTQSTEAMDCNYTADTPQCPRNRIMTLQLPDEPPRLMGALADVL